MALFYVAADGSDRYVEAESMAEAVQIWKDWYRNETTEDGVDDDPGDPDSVHLVDRDDVLRKQP